MDLAVRHALVHEKRAALELHVAILNTKAVQVFVIDNLINQ